MTRADIANGSIANVVKSSHRHERFTRCCVAVSDFSNLVFGKFCAMHFNALYSPLLGTHVAGVNGVCTKEEVFAIYARSIVTSMANKQTVRDGSVGYRPRKSCGVNHISFSDSEITIAIVQACFPVPAIIRASDGNFGPETINASLVDLRDYFREVYRGFIHSLICLNLVKVGGYTPSAFAL